MSNSVKYCICTDAPEMQIYAATTPWSCLLSNFQVSAAEIDQLIWPRLVKRPTLAKSDKHMTDVDQHWPDFAQIRRPACGNTSNSARIWRPTCANYPKHTMGLNLFEIVTRRPPNAIRIWPVLVNLGQYFASSEQIRPSLTKLGQLCWSNLAADMWYLLRKASNMFP